MHIYNENKQTKTKTKNKRTTKNNKLRQSDLHIRVVVAFFCVFLFYSKACRFGIPESREEQQETSRNYTKHSGAIYLICVIINFVLCFFVFVGHVVVFCFVLFFRCFFLLFFCSKKPASFCVIIVLPSNVGQPVDFNIIKNQDGCW